MTDLEKRVSAILRDQWDPIGLGPDGPRDEYDSYVVTAIRQTRSGPGHAALWLAWVRSHLMGLGSADVSARDKATAKALRAVVFSLEAA